MKLKYTLEIVNMVDEYIAVPVGDSAQSLQGVIKLNKEGREILNLLQSEITEEEIVNQLSKAYDNDPIELKTIVHNFISKIEELGLLDD